MALPVIGLILAGAVQAGAQIYSAHVQSKAAKEAGEKQLAYTERLNKRMEAKTALSNRLARKDWRELMAREDREIRKRDIKEQIAKAQNAINTSVGLKTTIGNLWRRR